ncbi:UNVERIFIED_ORG: hypothetical protein E4P37_16280 [Bacillus sp. AZ43]
MAASTEVCPGCGAVLAPQGDATAAHPGASPSCRRLFETTLGGLHEEAGADPVAAALVALADAAYDAQHPVAGDADRLRRALAAIGVPGTDPHRVPAAWRTTVADVAADLDVIDLPALVTSWATAVRDDWTAVVAPHR